MKKIFIIMLLFFANINVFSQEKVAHFVFPRFEKATVLYKNNNQSNTELNYNTATEEMIYVGDDGRRMAIHPIDQIDTVYIAGRKFVPVGRAFNEVLVSGNVPLYVSYKCKMTQAGSSVGYGTSSTTAVDNISSLMGSGALYEFKLPDNVKATPSKNYYIGLNGDNVKVSKLKSLAKEFPQLENQIEQYIKDNKLKNNDIDFINVIEFINSKLSN